MFVLAQPSIVAFTPSFGDSVSARMFNYKINVNFLKSGNQNWDFSSFAQVSETFVIKNANPANTPYYATFPKSNIAIELQVAGTTMAYVYSVVNNDSLYTIGSRFPSQPSNDEDFIDPNIGFRYPLNMGGSFVDTRVTSQAPEIVVTKEYKYVG